MKFIVICLMIQIVVLIWKLCEISTQLYNYHVLTKQELLKIEKILKERKHE